MDLTKNITYKCDKCGRKMTSPGTSIPIKIKSNSKQGMRATYFKHICDNCNMKLTDLLDYHRRKFFEDK